MEGKEELEDELLQEVNGGTLTGMRKELVKVTGMGPSIFDVLEAQETIADKFLVLRSCPEMET
jgi:hypothetical protein